MFICNTVHDIQCIDSIVNNNSYKYIKFIPKIIEKTDTYLYNFGNKTTNAIGYMLIRKTNGNDDIIASIDKILDENSLNNITELSKNTINKLCENNKIPKYIGDFTNERCYIIISKMLEYGLCSIPEYVTDEKLDEFLIRADMLYRYCDLGDITVPLYDFKKYEEVNKSLCLLEVNGIEFMKQNNLLPNSTTIYDAPFILVIEGLICDNHRHNFMRNFNY